MSAADERAKVLKAMQGEMRREYRFDYRKSLPKPFCAAHEK